ncbi:MAG: integrase core domain-containing protein [Planctomycetota bacterium]
MFDRTRNGWPLKILVVIDEFTRECLALEVHRKFTSDQFVELIGNLISMRGVPKYIRSDNGPEFISKHVRTFLEEIDFGTSYIEPRSPWQNGFVESFNSRFRDECLNCEEFMTLREAQQVILNWMKIYNHKQPHSSLGGLTPVPFGDRCSALPNVAPLHLAKPSNEKTTQSVPS